MGLIWAPEQALNWSVVYDTHRFETEAGGFVTRRKKIEPFVIPILVESPLIAIWTDSDGKQPTWNLAGWVRGAIATSSLTNDIKTLNGTSQALQLGEATRLDFRDAPAGTYQLRVFPQRYLPDLRLRVYSYIGPIGDSTEALLDVARVDIARLEAKIDALQ